jgi:hypothetical protein
MVKGGALMGVIAMLALCVLGSAAAAQSWPVAGPLILELKAVFRDPATQWMVLACAAFAFWEPTVEFCNEGTTVLFVRNVRDGQG